jgi:hypothetical protein
VEFLLTSGNSLPDYTAALPLKRVISREKAKSPTIEHVQNSLVMQTMWQKSHLNVNVKFLKINSVKNLDLIKLKSSERRAKFSDDLPPLQMLLLLISVTNGVN